MKIRILFLKKKEKKKRYTTCSLSIFFRLSPFLCHLRRSFVSLSNLAPSPRENSFTSVRKLLTISFLSRRRTSGEGVGWFHRGDRIAKLSARSPDCCGSVGARGLLARVVRGIGHALVIANFHPPETDVNCRCVVARE